MDSELFNPESKSTGGEEWQWQALLDPPEVDMVAVELLPTLEHEDLKRSLGVRNRPDLLLLVAVTADQLQLLHNITSHQIKGLC